MIKNYFKTAWKSIRKNAGTSCIKIAGLAVGMTAAVLILLWVNNETSFDAGKDRGNIYRLTTRLPDWVWETTPLLLADLIKKESPAVEQVARLLPYHEPIFKIKGNLFYEKGCAYVDEAWFKLFNYGFTEGNAVAFDAHPFSIILSSSEAKKYFGGSSAVGQTIHIDSIDYQVRGVVPDAPVNSSFQYTSFIPISAILTNPQIRANDEQWGNANYITFVKTRAGSKPAMVASQITASLKNKSQDDGSTQIELLSLADMHFETAVQNSGFVHGNRSTVYIFSFLGFLLLLIACINYVNLTTAKASLRAKEISIRKIAGANRSNLFFQFVAESVLISLLALGATLLLLQASLPAFNGLTGSAFTLPLNSTALWKVLGITLTVALLLNSIYPALLLSSFKPMQVFRGVSILKIKDSSFRKALVVLQFTISVMLVAGTIIIFEQMRLIQRADPGYNRSQVIGFVLPNTENNDIRASLIKAIKQDLLTQNSIESVSVSNQPVVNIGSMCSDCADWAGRDTSYKPRIAQLSADADFEKTMQLQLKEGRWFRNDNGSDKKSFILNETAVKEFNLQGPVMGQSFIFKGDTGRITGVVKDFTYKSMHEKTGPLIIFNNPRWWNHFVVRSAANQPAPALSAIQKTWQKYLPESPLEYQFLDETFNSLYKKDQQTSLLILVFALVAIIISALGLFSLAAFEAEQRNKEIGIRKVLGASVAGILSLLSKDFVKLVCIAIFIASPLAWWAMTFWLQDFAYRITISWWMFAAAGLLSLLVALFTISFQAVKAAVANPVHALRTE